MESVCLFPHSVRKSAKNETKLSFGAYDDLSESGFFMHGLFQMHKKALDIRRYKTLSFSAELTRDCILTLEMELAQNQNPLPDGTYLHTAMVCGMEGKHTYVIPIDSFDIPASCTARLQFFKAIHISGAALHNVTDLSLKLAPQIALQCENHSMAVKEGETAEYFLEVTNCGSETTVMLFRQKNVGWETLRAEISPASLSLRPGGTHTVSVKFKMNPEIAIGGYEECEIQAVWQNGSDCVKLITGKSMAHPFLLMDKDEIQAVKDKIKFGGWAKKTLTHWKKVVDAWVVPEINSSNSYLFVSKNANMMRGAAMLYVLTGEESYVEKVIDVLKKTIDPEKGYMGLPKFTSQELVHEGGCFGNLALSYDLVYDHPSITPKEHIQIRAVFEKFMELIDVSLRKGEISNWTLYEAVGALYCAAVLEDRVKMNRFLYGTGGIREHLSKGVLSDGWWYEASIGYNLLCASLFSEAAQVVKHFGINFKEEWVPASYSKDISSSAPERDGLCREIWGGNDVNFRNIQMLWDSLLPYFDYGGVVFGINDSAETKIEGISHMLFDPRFDLAYYLYGKETYGQLVSALPPEERDLMFGLDCTGENVKDTPAWQQSTYAKNAGAVVLRSQKENIPQREQLQIGLKFGSHGGAHGHYDRASITSIRRYGKSLYNPMCVWYSYHTYMYKFYVQNSITHNMVTVDFKQQDPAEPRMNLFHSGKAMQVCALENRSRWCNPPYGGWKVDGDPTFLERMWNEARAIPMPENPPEYNTRTGFTEEILTRRLTVVTDDCCVVFDYAKGEESHDYDCLYHLQGLTGMEGNIRHAAHKERLSDDLLSSAQFITDCDVYHIKGTVKLSFEANFSEAENNGNAWLCRNRTGFNEYGRIYTNLFFLSPEDGELSIAYPPEYQIVNKQLFYKVFADERIVAQGQFGAWIFGRDEVDTDISDCETLRLVVRVKDVDFEKGFPQVSEKSIFWGNPVIVCEDGTEIPLHTLSLIRSNVDKGNGIGIDYAGGPVKLQTKLYDKAIPAEPVDRTQESVISVDLRGVHAKRFRGAIGGDYPVLSPEEEKGRRRTVALRSSGQSTRFISLLEPYEKVPQVLSAKALSENAVEILLQDGLRQVISVSGLETSTPHVTLEEYHENQLIRKEETKI